MKYKQIVIVLIFSFIQLSAFGQSFSGLSKTGMAAATFLSIEIGPRAKAMGGAFVAISDDPTALYWNTAGIAKIEQNTMIFSHTDWIGGVNLEFAGIVIPLQQFGVLGASITSLAVPEMKVRTVSQPNGTGEMFDASDLALSLSYARSVTDRFQIGLNVKYIHERIYNMSASTVAFDLGTLFKTDFNNMVLGFSISNFGGDMQLSGEDARVEVDIEPDEFGNNDRILAHLETEKFQLPLLLRFGVSMDVYNTEINNFKVGMDAVVPNDNDQYVNVGGEYMYNNFLALRGGYRSLFLKDSEEGFTFGVGINYNLFESSRLVFDYAYGDFGVFDNIQEFAISFSF